MKKCLVIFIATFYFGLTYSQKPSLEIEWGKDEVNINKTPINVHSTLKDIRKALGNETRYFSVDEKTTRLYIYDQHGLNFIIDTVAGTLDKIDIDWSPGRAAFDSSPKQLFSGNLSINGKQVLMTDGISSIKKIQKFLLKRWDFSTGILWTMANSALQSHTLPKRKKRFALFILFSARRMKTENYFTFTFTILTFSNV